eukprot:jgi/Mesvir1/13892/Mv25596-RA.3
MAPLSHHPHEVRETCTQFLAYAVQACGGDPANLPKLRDELQATFERFKRARPAAPSGRPWCRWSLCLYSLARHRKVVHLRNSKDLHWVPRAVHAALGETRQAAKGQPKQEPPQRQPEQATSRQPDTAAGAQQHEGAPKSCKRRASRRAQLLKDKGGLEVRPVRLFPLTLSGAGVANGTHAGTANGGDAVNYNASPREASVGDRLLEDVCIMNRGKTTRALSCVRLQRPIRGASVTFRGCEGVGPGTPALIPPGGAFSFTVVCLLEAPGSLRAVVLCEFHGFTVGRHLAIDANDDITRLTGPTAPYQRKERVYRDFGRGKPIEGGRPKMGQTAESPSKGPPLPQVRIPGNLRSLLASGKAEEQLKGMQLTAATYPKRMTLLLHLEEMQMEVDIKNYDLEGVEMKASGNKLLLSVLGLAEKRPSVVRGDAIIVQEAAGPERFTYRGYVHSVGSEDVLLGFHQSFHARWVQGKKYHVRFTFNRTTLQRMHQAVQMAPQLSPSLLFKPSKGHRPSSQMPGFGDVPCAGTGREPSWWNRKLNKEQQQAVRKIVMLDDATNADHHNHPAAFVIFGPPGTGKTTVVVEALQQVLRRAKSQGRAGDRILVCTPSNSACDLLLEKLKEGGVTPLDALRINARQRPKEDVPDAILPFCERLYNDTAGAFEVPSKEDILRVRMVVATCSSCAQIHMAGASAPGLFSHVFIDEVGHGMEPEALIPITCALRRAIPSDPYHAGPGALSHPTAAARSGLLVLAGDPRQLGPAIRSPLAKAQGLEMSMLERLMPDVDSPLWAAEDAGRGLSGSHMTMLVQNYRSHPAILELPSRLFYAGRLVACANVMLRESLCGWEGLPNKDFPIVFHGVNGRCEREGNSPSWFNVDEISAVHKYTASLMGHRRIKLATKDIAVITPYRKQVQKIRRLLAGKGLDGIKVGSASPLQRSLSARRALSQNTSTRTSFCAALYTSYRNSRSARLLYPLDGSWHFIPLRPTLKHPTMPPHPTGQPSPRHPRKRTPPTNPPSSSLSYTSPRQHSGLPTRDCYRSLHDICVH